MNEELKKLYESLVNRGVYTKTFEEFTTQYEAPEYRGRVFEYINTNERLRNELGLSPGSSLGDFEATYSIPVKKKEETSASSSQAGQLASASVQPTSATLREREIATAKNRLAALQQMTPTRPTPAYLAEVEYYTNLLNQAGEIEPEPVAQTYAERVAQGRPELTQEQLKEKLAPVANLPSAESISAKASSSAWTDLQRGILPERVTIEEDQTPIPQLSAQERYEAQKLRPGMKGYVQELPTYAELEEINRARWTQYQEGTLPQWEMEAIQSGRMSMPHAPHEVVGQQAMYDMYRQDIEAKKKAFEMIPGLGVWALSGQNLINSLYPSFMPGAEELEERTRNMRTAYLETWGFTPEEMNKSFSEQSDFKKAAVLFGMGVADATAQSALIASTMGMGGGAPAVGTLSEFGLVASRPGLLGMAQAGVRAAGTNIVTNPVSSGLMAYMGANNAYREVRDNPDMSLEEKASYITFSGAKQMLLESGFMGDIKLWNSTLDPAKQAAAKQTFKAVVSNFAKEASEQGVEEGTEEGLDWTGDFLWAYATGGELPEAREGWEAMAIGVVSPGLTSVSRYAPSIIDHAGGTVFPYSLPKSENLSQLSELKSQISKIDADMQMEGISEQEKTKLQEDKDKVNEEIYNLRRESIDARQSMSKEDQIELFIIDAKIEGLYDEFTEARTASRKTSIKNEVANLLESKRKIENAVQEQATSEVPVQPEAAVSEEMAEGAPQAEPEVTAEARVEEEVVTPTAEEAVTEEVIAEEIDAAQLTEEEQQQLAKLREETEAAAPVMEAEQVIEKPATMAEVNAAFEGGRKVSNNLSVNETDVKPLDKKETARRNRIEKIAAKGAKSIEKILPDTKVMLHSTEEEFRKYTGSPKTDEGAYDYNTNTIHINMATADASAVGHEVFHAVLLNEVKTNDKARAVAQKLIEGVRKSLPEGSELSAEIDTFAENYEENFQDEERLAQLTGAMSREYTKADQTVKGRIKKFIADLAKFFGIDLPSNFGKTDASVMAMFDTLSRKVSRGEVIQKEDVATIKKAKRAAGKRAAAKKVVAKRKPARKEQKVDTQDVTEDNAIRRKKGLITITPVEASKYEKMGITNQYRQQTIKDLSISTGKENMLINAISDGKIAEAIASSNKRIASEFPGALTDAKSVQKKLNSINVKDPNSVLKTMEDLMPDGTSLDNLDFVMSQVAVNISKELKSGSYLGQPVVIETDSEAITKAMLFEADQAQKMGFSRSRVAKFREGVNDPDTRAAFMEQYRETQQESLNKWADALANAADGNNLYFNLLMADAVATNNYDASEKRYFKRSPKTIRNFTPFDAGTLQRVELETNVDGAALLKTYIEIQKENIPNIVKSFEYSKDADGTWLMFPGGSNVDAADLSENSNALMQLVQETIWCTKTDGYNQLKDGNFYVYVTKEKGEFEPRIAVRTEDNGQTIREVRGIAPGQQMEPEMNPKAVKFLTETLPISGGKVWVEGNEFNKAVQEYTAEIQSREVTIDDFKRVAEIEEKSARFSVLQHGENGFVEALREELDFAVSNNRLEPRLKGNVTDDSRKIRPNTVMFLGNLDVSDVVETGIIHLHESSKASDAAFNSFSQRAVGNEEAVLKEYYGEAKYNEMLKDAMAEATSGIEIIEGDLDIRPISIGGKSFTPPVPSSLTTVSETVSLDGVSDLGSLESTGAMYLFNYQGKTLGENINIVGKLSVTDSDNLQSLGSLKTVEDNLIVTSPDLTDLGSLEFVGATAELSGTSITTTGNLKFADRIELPATIKDLGVLESVKGELAIHEDSKLTDLGQNIKSVGAIGLKYKEGFKKAEMLESLGGLEVVSDGLNLSIKPGTKLKDLGNLKRINILNVEGESPSLKSLGENIESAGSIILKDNTALDFGNLNSVSLDVTVENSTVDFGNLNDIALGGLYLTGAKIKDFGKIQSVGGDLAINGLVDSPSAINSIKSVDGNVTILDGPTSLGSIETIGKDLVAPELEDIGSLKSFGQDSHDVQMAIASGYITPEAGGKMLDIIANNERAANDIPSPTTIRRKVGSGIAYENWKASPQSKAQFVGHRFNMNHKGFVPKTTDPAQFKIAVERLHERLSIKAYRDERTGEISGYSMRLDNKFFNPFLKVVQREGDAASLRRKASNYRNQNIHEFINDARGKGYTDRVISAFLKEQGHAAADIKSALEVPVDILGTTLPDGFANAEGGVAVGQQLYNDVIAEVEKYAAAKRLGMPVHSKAQIREKAQELLVNSDVFKAQNPIVQAEMQIGLDKALNIPSASKQLQADFKAVRAMLSNVKKGAAEVSKAKNAMRMFIRKNLPQTVYEKSDVNKLMKAITDATPDSLPAVMQRVSELVNGFHVRDLNASIDKLLKTPTTKVSSGRKVGRMSVSTQNILGMLNDKANPMLVDEGTSPENVEKMMDEQTKEFNKLQTKTRLTEPESDKLTALSIAMMYNEATQMGEDNPYRVEALAAVRDNLKGLISTGRSQMRGQLDAQRAYYNNLISEAYRGVTGEALDLSEEGAEANAEAIRSLRNNQKRKSAYKGGLISFGDNLIDGIDKWYFARQSDLSLLIQRMSSGLAEAAGGNNLMDIFDDRLYDSRVEFTVGKKKAMDALKNKAQQIWGKDYLVEMERNSISRASSDLIKDKNIIWRNKGKAEALRKEYDSADSKRKKAIVKELEGLEVALSQNEKYYLYNQYKDPANTASFKEKYGEEYARVMKEIEKSLDPKVKEWADWQVNEFYPSLYDRYNQVYKAIYRTNMPWNQFYAGRIYRESEEGDTKFDLLDKGSQYQTSVGGQSTKMRKKNARPIMDMNGDNVLNSYVKDMEYFHAYAESLRDLDKVLQNKDVKAAMIEAGGVHSYNALSTMIGRIAKRGVHGEESEVMNALMNNFVKAKLGLNPTIFLKQLTSGIAFADNIGYRNWAEYTALAMPQARTLWKEWYDNSPLLQERYEDSDIAKVLETYDYQKAATSSPFILDKSIAGKDVTISKRKTAEALNAMMYLVKQGDKGGVMGGLANYLYYKQEFLKKNPGDTEGAIAYASKKTTKEALRTQQDSGITNKDYYQTAGPALRFLTLFTSSPRALLRKEMSAFLSLNRKLNGLPTQDGYRDIARRLITFHVLAPTFFQWVALGFPGLFSDWDEEDTEAMGRAAILGNFNAIFLVGDVINTAKDLYEGNPWAGEFKTIPLFDQLSTIAKDYQSWEKTKDEGKKNEKFDKLVDHVIELSGIPATNMHRWYNNVEKLLSEDMDKGEALLRLFNYSEYAISGGDKEETSKKKKSKGKSTKKTSRETSRDRGVEALRKASEK